MRVKLKNKIFDMQVNPGLDDTDKITLVHILRNLAENEQRFFSLCEIPAECEDE